MSSGCEGSRYIISKLFSSSRVKLYKLIWINTHYPYSYSAIKDNPRVTLVVLVR